MNDIDEKFVSFSNIGCMRIQECSQITGIQPNLPILRWFMFRLFNEVNFPNPLNLLLAFERKEGRHFGNANI